MAAIFRSHIAFPEFIFVETFTMEDGAVILIEDTQGRAEHHRRFRLGDYRPMNEEAADMFDAACAALALVPDSERRSMHDFITESIQSRLNGFIGGKMTDATMRQMRCLVEETLSDDVRAGRIRDFSVAVVANGQIEVKATLPPTVRQVVLDPRYQMTFDLK